MKIAYNPLTSQIEIGTPNAVHYEIYDLTGKLLKSEEVKNQKTDSLKLNSGVYLVKMFLKGNTTMTNKILIK